VKLFLPLASIDLGDEVDRAATCAFGLRIQSRRLANVASSATACGEFTIDRFALDAFADYATISVDIDVGANIAST
jgi:hypothetical protein